MGLCKRTKAVILLGISLPGALLSQEWQVFTMQNAGLPSNTIVDVVSDGQGVLWVATDWGLGRYAGGDWTVIQATPDGLPDNSLSCLAVDGEDRLWVGTITAGIGIYDGNTWSYLNNGNSPLVTEGVKHIHHDHRGWAWISTEVGLFVDTGSGWRIYNSTPESYNGSVFFGSNMNAVVVRADELVSVATVNAGLSYITETDFVYYTSANSNFPDNSGNAIVLDSNGDRWLATPAGGLIWHAGDFQGGPWFQYSAFTTGIPDNTMGCLIIDGQGRKLAGTQTAGILVFNGPGDWYMLNTSNSGLPDDWVTALYEDQAGVLWVGTADGGLARYEAGVGMVENAGAAWLHVHPNPYNDHVHVDLHDFQGPVIWRILDLAGRSVGSGSMQGGSVQRLGLEHLAQGTYLLQATASGRIGQVRIHRER